MYDKGFEIYPVNLLRIKIIQKRLKKFKIKFGPKKGIDFLVGRNFIY